MQKRDMVYNVELTNEAITDLNVICRYITDELKNPLASERIYRKILNVAESLREFPMRGENLFEQFKLSYRCIPANNYMIIYRIQETSVIIIRILYKRKDVSEAVVNEQ